MTDDPMDQESETLDLASFDIAETNRQEFLRLFPEVRTEGGRIDFERLRAVLGEMVDAGRERFGLNWPGKADCMRTIQSPSMATLLPCVEESVDWHTTENLILEGDNLEVLKLLQKSYLGKVNMIYIDPPYNTGNDFIYPDNYGETLQTYLEYSGQTDVEGRKFSTNTDTDGRFHSKWLNMMYPRLYLARNLLSEDGAIWISIDDVEVSALRFLCNEVFGEENFVATFIWEKRRTRENRRVFSVNHDYILCYARSKELFEAARNLLPQTEAVRARYRNPDSDPRGDWQSVALTAQAGHGTPSQTYTITTPSGRRVDPPPGNCWRVTSQRLHELIADNRIWFGTDGGNVPRQKVFLSELEQGLTPHTLWQAEEVGTTDSAKRELNDLFQGNMVFDTPKPTSLLARVIQISMASDGICMDFFAGSGATAQAVMAQNAVDGGSRRFILVQLPEPTEDPVHPNIADITRKRVIHAAKHIQTNAHGALGIGEKGDQDLGFRAYRLAESNFKPWDANGSNESAGLEKQLALHIEHVRHDRKATDILYEILLKSGFPLTISIVEQHIAGKQVFIIADGALVICLDRELSLDLIRGIGDLKPERVVMLDAGFDGDDKLKTNAVQTFKNKGVESFKVV